MIFVFWCFLLNFVSDSVAKATARAAYRKMEENSNSSDKENAHSFRTMTHKIGN